MGYVKNERIATATTAYEIYPGHLAKWLGITEKELRDELVNDISEEREAEILKVIYKARMC